jgi:hypothetical protein
MNMRVFFFAAAGVLTFLAAARAAQPELPPFNATLLENRLTVNGVTPRGGVALLIVSRDESSERWPVVNEQHERLRDEDGDGVATFDFPAVPPQFTVVGVVDESDGRAVVVTPGPDFGRLPETAFAGDGAGRPLRFSSLSRFAHAMLVRPGKGVWTSALMDGSLDDVDGLADQRSTLEFRRMKQKDGGLQGPEHLLPHDTLVVIDTLNLKAFASTVREQP